MRLLALIAVLGGLTMTTNATANCGPALDFELRRLAGDESVRLCDAYQGKVVLMVNTASKCGFTGQYEGLEALYDKYKERGLVVLGFPSNDFGNQEPGSEEQIQQFCRLTYSVEFPMFEKIHVKKGVADPLYQYLAAQTGAYPKWNFYKYLIDRDGKVVDYFSSITSPDSKKFIAAIEKLL
ncbi:glutathione peroxidase [Lamprobacter modestohalophilus]|uniref:Glutathione peroxidase n=2 Tax=Lamprobacter modestohalophilus TaxID=1064514 RepID=A0A9X0WBV9_9GAMM|nr:glutathione peroxidase [Lamprobacter modestohalophilus]MCF7977507.1 glutathione peroxidase [Chromatiaceae bacterium]MCF7993249.1 glutathione peroxidase [Chromatiaceae bacterium]MCF8017308.1 glutathione peroxidase [Chromatiaceae bacterium]